MSPSPFTGPNDRFEEELRSLHPRAASAGLRGRTARKLAAPRAFRFISRTAAAMVLIVFIAVLGGLWSRKWTENSRESNLKDEASTVAVPPACECRVRFTPQVSGRPTSSGPVPPSRAVSRRLDRPPSMALRSIDRLRHLFIYVGVDSIRVVHGVILS